MTAGRTESLRALSERAQRTQLPPAARRDRRGRGRLGHRRRTAAATSTCSRRTRRSTSATATRRLIAAAQRQLDRVTLVSRAFDHDQFGPFCAELAELAGMEMVLPMNTGAEAVETAIKTARKWGYEVKGVPADEAVIIAFEGNFHGRTTTIISFSTDPDARASFGPYTPGFRVVPYGDVAALAEAMDHNVVGRPDRADPGRGRRRGAAAGLPGRGPRAVHGARGAHDRRRDPVRAGPDRHHLRLRARGRACPTCTCSARPSAAASCRSPRSCPRRDVLGVFRPGQHGSTFGGNPLACAVGREVIALLATGEYQERSAKLGDAPARPAVRRCPGTLVRQVRGRGLWAGIEFTSLPGRVACERLARARRAGQGHARHRDPARAAADDQRAGPGLGAGPDRGGPPRLSPGCGPSVSGPGGRPAPGQSLVSVRYRPL